MTGIVGKVAGVLAIIPGLFCGFFALVMLSGSGVSVVSVTVMGATAIAFLTSGFLGALGLYPRFLAAVWVIVLATFVFTAWGADGGFMDGGLFIFGALLYLVVGTAMSLIGWRRDRP